MFVLIAALSCTTPTDTVPPAAIAPSPLVFKEGAPRNLLMISIDTLRKDHLGFYGGPANTPFLDQLLAGSVHLDNHMQCSSWTYASMGCTLMGRSNESNGYTPLLQPVQYGMPETSGFLAEFLADAGFFTMVHSHNEWLSSRWGNTRGYAIEADYGPTTLEAATQASDLLLKAAGTNRWALHLHLLEPHAPYVPPDAYLDSLDNLPLVPFDLSTWKSHYDVVDEEAFADLAPDFQEAVEAHLRARYIGELEWLDDQLADVFDDYRAKGLLDDTLVVVWSDHGEAFWEHGHQTHAWDLFPEENDAILAFSAPGLAPKAWTGPTHSTDLVPTLLDLWGLTIPTNLEGIRLGHAREDRVRYASVVARKGPVQMIRQGDDALYYDWRTGLLQQFHLADDPQAIRDTLEPTSTTTQALWSAMQPWTALLDSLTVTDSPSPTQLD